MSLGLRRWPRWDGFASHRHRSREFNVYIQPSKPQPSAPQNHLNLQATEPEQGRRILFNQQLETPQAGFTMDLPVPFEKGLKWETAAFPPSFPAPLRYTKIWATFCLQISFVFGYWNRQAWKFLPILLDFLTPFRMDWNVMTKPEIYKQALSKGGYRFVAGQVTVATCNKCSAAPLVSFWEGLLLCYDSTATSCDSKGRLPPHTPGKTFTDASRVNVVWGTCCFSYLWL